MIVNISINSIYTRHIYNNRDVVDFDIRLINKEGENFSYKFIKIVRQENVSIEVFNVLISYLKSYCTQLSEVTKVSIIFSDKITAEDKVTITETFKEIKELLCLEFKLQFE